ncbi:Chemotaxis response regulator protein-glutamate methylesterase [Polystyrenella longa]|uniref:Protein-glutamate methylesterase/protein-glutamine glutaminase n=1 Tax=Polystyrenella longa TaxID=2528007 RepID=A0A518CNX1_9PLAN|nr:chemotaxis response regulator protein-glutamate methylesterase [Polystyrenella longa]QDU80926.1 Chemotaxis response regulator protein-glutamate methylesterase [Polystyrenella longa]
MIQSNIRVLIVDDSAVIRGLLARALQTDSGIEVTGTSMHGEAALSFLKRNEVDVVLLDVEMPVMDGLTTLQEIQKQYPDVHVIMVSSYTMAGAEDTVSALSMGAAGCVAKPISNSPSESIRQLSTELLPMVKSLGQSRLRKSTTPVSVRRDTIVQNNSNAGPMVTPQLVVIGTSTGGPQALRTVLTGLPKDFPLPILIVQHMPPMFTPMLAKHIAQDTGRPAKEAEHNEPIQRGVTYVAPGDFHMEVNKLGDRMVLQLNQKEPEHYCRPSVNPLFRTAASWYRNKVLGVMLTGMGEDGIEGTRTLVENGGYMMAQNEATCVVYGMPRAVVDAGLAKQILPIDSVADEIAKHCAVAVKV